MKNRNGPKSILQVESVVSGGQGGRSMWVSRFGKVYQAVGGKCFSTLAHKIFFGTLELIRATFSFGL